MLIKISIDSIIDNLTKLIQRHVVNLAMSPIIGNFNNKLLVEIKLSTNKKLCEGLDKQLEAYKRAEYTDNGFFVLIRLSVKGEKENNYINFHKKMSELKTKGSISKISAVLEIDGRLKPSASKL